MRVALVGARGHGANHVENLVRLGRTGKVTFIGVVDVADVDVPVPVYPTLEDLLAEQHADIVVVSSPPHTHRDLVLGAFEAGCDVLVEKPALLNRADFAEVSAVAAEKGLVCQVGFQSQGKGSYRRLCELVGTGGLGDIHGIGAVGRWVRLDSYYERASWAGTQGPDGTLVNPYAHAVQNALLLAGIEDRDDLVIELELFRCRPENTADDTSCLRVTAEGAPPIVVATTLCAAEPHPPYVVVHGSLGRAMYWYDDDRLEVNDHEMHVVAPVDLLENLIEHRERGVPLLAPLSASRAFTAVVQAVGKASVTLADAHRNDDRVVLDGVDDIVVRAGEKLATFAELGAPWTR